MADSADLPSAGFDHHYDYVIGEEMLETFYVPMLKNALRYDRVAGYFSSSVFSHASAGFAKFCSRAIEDGFTTLPRFRLIVGARLNHIDENIVLGMESSEILEDEALIMIEEMRGEIEKLESEERIIEAHFAKSRFSGLSWMLEKGILEIKVGARYDPNTNMILPHQEAEFHPKFGIVSDGDNEMYFGGSANETRRAWLDNYETIDVSRSWEGEDTTISTYKSKFEELWGNNRTTKGVLVLDFPQAAKNKMLESFPPSDPSDSDEVRQARERRQWISENSSLAEGLREDYKEIEREKVRWEHQPKSRKWFREEAGGVGIYQMATGSGKTWTAIDTIKEMVQDEDNPIRNAIICIPKTIEEQWMQDLSERYSERHSDYYWNADKKEFADFFMDDHKNSVLLVSHWFLPQLLEVARKNPNKVKKTMLVIDELHNIGAPGYKGLLVSTDDDVDFHDELDDQEKVVIKDLREDDYLPFPSRLGLSATPWDDFDDERNQYIINGFTKDRLKMSDMGGEWRNQLVSTNQIFNFGLKEGIEKGILCEFKYEPLDYVPNNEDIERRKEFGRKVDPNLPSHLKQRMARIQAARAFKISKMKIGPFKKWLRKHLEEGGSLERSLIFVAEKEYGKSVMSVLAKDFKITNFRTFFQGEPKSTIDDFAIGKLDFLIACKRISEGLNIKQVQTIVLFSSDSGRLTTTQRIGRALRIDPQNKSKKAIVVDFICREKNKEEEDTADRRRLEWLSDLSETRGPSD